MSSLHGWIWVVGVAVLFAGLVGASRWRQSRKINPALRNGGRSAGDGADWPASRIAPDTQAGRI